MIRERYQISRIPFYGPKDQIKKTLSSIGQAILNAAEYLPIRNHAAKVAARAKPKDFIGQLNAVYQDFISRWKYVRDPIHKELVTYSPQAVAGLILGLDGMGAGEGVGVGDCDDATVALGALLSSIGFPVRMATTAAPGKNKPWSHVFIQAHTPIGWVSVDPVLHPHAPPLMTAPHSKIAYYDLKGELLGYGNTDRDNTEGDTMLGNAQFQDYSGLYGVGYYQNNPMPQDWETVGLKDFGYLSASMGLISGDEIPPIAVEVMTDAQGFARTPMLELSPSDYKFMQTVRTPYDGMLALGDDGEVYVYDGMGSYLGRGWFKRLRKRIKKGFQRIRKGVKKIASRIRSGLKKVISKLPGGKTILKIAGKIRKVAMKIVKPLVKFVGKYASKLAPIAALIPGYGPAIAAGLKIAGKVANAMNKYGVKIAGKAGQVRTLVSKDPEAIKRMQQELAIEAQKLKTANEMKRRMGLLRAGT